MKIPIGPFFLVTSILMAVLVVIFAGGGIHALIEGDLIDGHYLSSVPTNDWIGLYPYVECLAAQAIAAIAVHRAVRRRLRTQTQVCVTNTDNRQVIRKFSEIYPIFFPTEYQQQRKEKQ